MLSALLLVRKLLMSLVNRKEPPLMKRKIDYRQEQLVLRVEPQLRRAIEHEALDQNRTLSGMAKHILASWMRAKETGAGRPMTTAA
jgi:hypothetical protein